MKTDAKHTPGPWQVSGSSIVAGEICIAAIEDDGGYEAPYDEREANAALIARAPELLAENAALKADNERLRGELKILDDCLKSGRPNLDDVATLRESIRQALAAGKESGK